MQIILVILIIAGAVFYLSTKLIKQFGKKKEDDCGCGKCG